MSLNDTENEIVIEIKIKCTPSMNLREILERIIPVQGKPTDDNHSVVESISGGPAKTIPMAPHRKPLSTRLAKSICATPPAESEGEPLQKPRPDTSGIPWPSKPTRPLQSPEFPAPLKQIGKIDENDFITEKPQDIEGFNNILYRETKDKRLLLIYGTSKMYTTWADIHVIAQLTDKNEIKGAIERLVAPGRIKNKYTAVSRFVKAVKFGKVHPWRPAPRETDDPDAAYRPILSGVIDTNVDTDLDDQGSRL